VPVAIKKKVASFIGEIPNARWIKPDNYHITIRFIGSVENWQTYEIDSMMKTISFMPFSIKIKEFDFFIKPHRRTKILLKIEKSSHLKELREKIESAIYRCGFNSERRKFIPHITLARINKINKLHLQEFLKNKSPINLSEIYIDRFVLFQSHIGKLGANYQKICEYKSKKI